MPETPDYLWHQGWLIVECTRCGHPRWAHNKPYKESGLGECSYCSETGQPCRAFFEPRHEPSGW